MTDFVQIRQALSNISFSVPISTSSGLNPALTFAFELHREEAFVQPSLRL